MALSPPRSPPRSAPATRLTSASPKSTRHSTLTPAPASIESSPPSRWGIRPWDPATVTCRIRAPRSVARRFVHRLHGATARGRRVVARRPRGHRHRLEVRRHGGAAYFGAVRGRRALCDRGHTTNVRSHLACPESVTGADGPLAAAPVVFAEAPGSAGCAPMVFLPRPPGAGRHAAGGIRHAEVIARAQAARNDVPGHSRRRAGRVRRGRAAPARAGGARRCERHRDGRPRRPGRHPA